MPAEGEVVSEIPSGAQPRGTKGTAATGAAGGRFVLARLCVAAETWRAR